MLGPNGSGKSTLLKLIAGLTAPGSGRLRVLGADAATEPEVLLDRTNFIPGVLTGGAWVDSSQTPRRNLRFVAELFGMAPTDDEIDRVLGWLGMAEWADSRVGTLSSGTTAKLQLAFGLISASMVWLINAWHDTEPVHWLIGVLVPLVAGSFSPPSVLPGWLQAVSACLPHTYALDAIRRSVLGATAAEASGGAVERDLVALAAFTVVLLTAGVLLFRRSLEVGRRRASLG